MPKYTTQFKIQVAKEAIKAKTYAEVSKKYGVHTSNIKIWTNLYAKYGELGFEDGGIEKFNQQHIRDLEKKVADLEEENEILKKATAFFSRGNR